MKSSNLISFTAIYILSCILSLHAKARTQAYSTNDRLYFTENKGQVRDQYGKPSKDIQFVLQSPGMTVFIGNGQLHYQFSHARFPADFCTLETAGIGATDKCSTTFDVDMYRMDVALVGADTAAEYTTSAWQAYHESYYQPGTGENGAHARTCMRVVYKNIYPGIDWILFIKDNKLEHEFSLSPNADAELIQLRYDGASSLSLCDDGSLHVTTPMGSILEQKPVCYAGARNVASSYRLRGNVLSYNIAPYSGTLLIDPSIHWGTYYGEDTAQFTGVYQLACDSAKNIYGGGKTTSAYAGTIATVGSYQYTYAGGSYDAFIVKFDSAGHRLWATYYGGDGHDNMDHLVWHPSNYLFFTGGTNTTSGLTTPGCQQPIYGGGATDGLIAKFDTSGTRIWATYCGGSLEDGVALFCHDTLGNLYLLGYTTSTDNISTPGSYKPIGEDRDPFLMKYDVAGNRIWGTYYGGENIDAGVSICSDGMYVYISGSTNSSTGISTPGCHQPAHANLTSYDSFIAKFDSAGNRMWGTYYGGALSDGPNNMRCNSKGELLIIGRTYSDTGIATPGSQQPFIQGSHDGFLLRMSANGVRLACRYIGGPGYDQAGYMALDAADNICLTGFTESDTGLTTPDAWRTMMNGTNDPYILFMNDTGDIVWSTYWGGSAKDAIQSIIYDGSSYYISGITNSTDSIATPGSFKPTTTTSHWLANIGFIMKFGYPDTAVIDTPVLVQPIAADVAKIDIYPNPNTGTFAISGTIAENDGVMPISITDIYGRVVLNSRIAIQNGSIDAQIVLPTSLPTGSYFVQLHTKYGAVTKRILKK